MRQFQEIDLGPFHCAKFKKEWIQSYMDAPFLGPKDLFAPKNIFSENPLVNLVAFIHVYLHAKNQS